MTYHIMNADLCEAGYSPRSLKRGDVVEIKQRVTACPWKTNADPVILPGKYHIICRKGFKGGSQEIEPVAC